MNRPAPVPEPLLVVTTTSTVWPKPVPLTVTPVPPPVPPARGEIPLVNALTVGLDGGALSAGVVTVSDVCLPTLVTVAAAPPIVTLVTQLDEPPQKNPLPLMLMLVSPPAPLMMVCETEVTVGGAANAWPPAATSATRLAANRRTR